MELIIPAAILIGVPILYLLLQRRFIDGTVEDFLAATSALARATQADAGVNVGLAPHSVRAVPEKVTTLRYYDAVNFARGCAASRAADRAARGTAPARRSRAPRSRARSTRPWVVRPNG